MKSKYGRILQNIYIGHIRPAYRTYAEIRNKLRLKGTPIETMDMFVASVAKFNNMVLITHNTKHFERIENLEIEDWQL